MTDEHYEDLSVSVLKEKIDTLQHNNTIHYYEIACLEATIKNNWGEIDEIREAIVLSNYKRVKKAEEREEEWISMVQHLIDDHRHSKAVAIDIAGPPPRKGMEDEI